MTYFYSPLTSGLYDDTFHFKQEIPSDAIELTDEEYLNYWTGLNSNKVLILNTNGKLELVAKALSNEELIKPFSANLQKHLDDTASSYGYDNIYTAISYAFMVLYLVPILTIGVYKILKKEPILKVEGVPAVEESRV